MKKIIKLIIIALFLLNFKAFSQTDTVFIDFGATASVSADPWNNVSSYLVSSQNLPLKNNLNLTTSMSISVTDRFGGVNESGTLAAGPDVIFPANATKDSFFGNIAEFSGVTEPTGEIQFSGLNPAKLYEFIFFASRLSVTDNRETKYKFNGLSIDSIYLNPANNVNTTSTISMKPNEEGIINIEVSPGENNTNSPYRFYYLGLIEMIYEHEDALPAEINVISPNGDELWLEGSNQNISWSSVNLTEDIDISYSTDNGENWTRIAKVSNTEQTFSWLIPNTISDECLVKLMSGTAVSQSNEVFSIANLSTPKLRLKSPNGGEKWIAGSSHNILWQAISLTENIVLNYSTDNGINWSEIASLAPDTQSYKWIVPSNTSSECMVRISSAAEADTSRNVFSIIEAQCTNTIVVLGSSTAYGTGPSSIDSSWVRRYSAYLESINSDFNVINLALGGYTSYQILPTGAAIHSGVTESIDVSRNITKALSYSPYAVIINMPSNDANKYYSSENQIDNYNTIIDYAGAEGVKVWVATVQPRNFSDPVQIQIQMDLKDTIPELYGDYSIDFWNGTADESGHILAEFNTDGVHMNSDGHRLLFERVKEKQIDTLACLATGINSFMIDHQAVNIYPNPFENNTKIEFETEAETKVEIRFFDYTGKNVGYMEEWFSETGSKSILISESQIQSKSNVIIGVISFENKQGRDQTSFKLIRVGLN